MTQTANPATPVKPSPPPPARGAAGAAGRLLPLVEQPTGTPAPIRVRAGAELGLRAAR
jgi:hypothetical protein